MRGGLKVLLLGVLSVSFALTAQAASLPYKAKVIQVISGTIFKLETGQRIYLKGIKTVEAKKSEALKALNELVFDKRVRLDYEPREPDRFGRIFAYVFLDGTKTMVNRELVDRGLAELIEISGNSWNKKKLMGIEEKKSSEPFVDEYEEMAENIRKQNESVMYKIWIGMVLAIVLGIVLRRFLRP